MTRRPLPSMLAMSEANDAATVALWDTAEFVLGPTGSAIRLVGAIIDRCPSGVSPLRAIGDELHIAPQRAGVQISRAKLLTVPIAHSIVRVRVAHLATVPNATFDDIAAHLGRGSHPLRKTLSTCTGMMPSAWLATATPKGELAHFADELRRQGAAFQRWRMQSKDFVPRRRGPLAGRECCPVCGTPTKAVA